MPLIQLRDRAREKFSCARMSVTFYKPRARKCGMRSTHFLMCMAGTLTVCRSWSSAALLTVLYALFWDSKVDKGCQQISHRVLTWALEVDVIELTSNWNSEARLSHGSNFRKDLAGKEVTQTDDSVPW